MNVYLIRKTSDKLLSDHKTKMCLWLNKHCRVRFLLAIVIATCWNYWRLSVNARSIVMRSYIIMSIKDYSTYWCWEFQTSHYIKYNNKIESILTNNGKHILNSDDIWSSTVKHCYARGNCDPEIHWGQLQQYLYIVH